jgi:hypothetical protein
MNVSQPESIAPTRNRTRNITSRNQKWTTEEDALLHQIVQSNDQAINWKAAESQFPGKTSQQLFERWTKVLDPRLLKGSWTRQKDEVIIGFVHQYGCTAWTKLAHMLPGRIGKQCRERWFNHLNPDLSRGQWTPTEDQLLMQLHEQFGNHWATIAAHMPTRADNMIKNRWYSTLSKKSKEEVAEAAETYRSAPDQTPTVRFTPPQAGDVMPTPGMTLDGTQLWNSPVGLTPSASTPFQVPSLSIPVTPTSIGFISPMAPSQSPFSLNSPYQKIASMFSPWSMDGSKSLFSPVGAGGSPQSLSENRAKLVTLIVQQ